MKKASSVLLILAATHLAGCAKLAARAAVEGAVNAASQAVEDATQGKPKPPASASILSFDDFVRAEAQSDASLGLTDAIATASPSHAAGPSPLASCDAACTRRRQEFRYVVYVGKQIYAYWDLKKADTHLDYDALAQSLEKSITSNSSMTDYYQVLRRWAAAFHDGHVNAMYKDDDTDLEVYTAPVRLEVLAPATDHEKVIVSQLAIAQNFDIAHADIKVGDQVLAVGGKPARQALDEVEQITSGSTARMRRVDGVRRLVDVLGAEAGAAPLVLSVLRPGASAPHDVTLYRTAELSVPPSGNSGADSDTGADYFHALVLPGSMGYLRMDAFEGSQDELLISQAMQRLSATRGLLIDVRRNGGGDQSGNALLSRLATAAITRYKTSPRMADFTISQRPSYFAALSWTPGQPFAAWHDELVQPAAPEARYTDRPVVLLTGTDCFSACDTFSSALKTNSLATVVGEPTGGGTGTPLVFKLPVTGLSFRYSVVRGMTADGKPIEGVGTAPDQLIERTQDERVAGHDEQLLKALTVLAHQIQERTPTTFSGATESAVEQALSSISPSWAQDGAISPTRSADRRLRALSAKDEIDILGESH
jgi:C-terminal processing protease CtpA/Prc